MSRLDSFLRRLTAQHVCLGACVPLIETVPGPVWELGLGSGRSYDHLCHLFPDRDVQVFEHRVSEDAAGMVPPDQMIIGDMRETLANGNGRATSSAQHVACACTVRAQPWLWCQV